MNQDVASYLDNIGQPWQAEICQSLHGMVHRAIPGVTERLQYGKPHYLADGKYACVIGTAKGWVTCTIFNAAALNAPEGLFEPGPPDRKTIKIRQGQAVDYDQLAALLRQAEMATPAEQPSLPWPSTLGQPARRALAGAGYTRLDQLAAIGEAEIARLHGIGPNALKQLRQALAAHGLSFAADRAEGG